MKAASEWTDEDKAILWDRERVSFTHFCTYFSADKADALVMRDRVLVKEMPKCGD